MNSKKEKYSVVECQGCGADVSGDLHGCPFQEDIHANYETQCNCCDECMSACADEI